MIFNITETTYLVRNMPQISMHTEDKSNTPVIAMGKKFMISTTQSLSKASFKYTIFVEHCLKDVKIYVLLWFLWNMSSGFPTFSYHWIILFTWWILFYKWNFHEKLSTKVTKLSEWYKKYNFNNDKFDFHINCSRAIYSTHF